MTQNTTERAASDLLQPHLDTPFYRALKALYLFRTLRRLSRTAFRLRTQRRALRGHGLVPEDQLRATYIYTLMMLRDHLGFQGLGDYAEFGVCHGSSMACLHEALEVTGTPNVRLFGFDSFEGLPPEADTQDNRFFSAGQFDSSLSFTRHLLTRRGVDWTRTHLIQGWFRDTCTDDTVERYGLHRRGLSLVLIDCDIYSAAKEALDFVGPLLTRHAVIVFDDWNAGDLAVQDLGEKKAFSEFILENPQFHAHQLPNLYRNSAVFLLSRMTTMRPDGKLYDPPGAP